MPIARDELTAHIDHLLDADRYRDYGPNGLQVAGSETIGHLATACTASLSNCRAAVAAGADALLVHHGLFWGRGPITVTGMLKPRLASLLASDCNLLAYHLPLDGHAELGNNAIAMELLGIEGREGFADAGAPVGRWGRVASGPIGAAQLADRCRAAFDHEVIHCPGGPDRIERVAVITGGGQNYLQEAAALGCHALITGETSEQSWHEAAECGCHLFACGHHATEAIAIHRLGEGLASTFDLRHTQLPERNPL